MEIVITSIIAFISTNIDDVFILTLFYGNKKFNNTEILIGQFVGIAALIAISLLGSLVELLIDQAYVGLLGVIPIYLGLKGLWEVFKNEKESESGPDPAKATKKNSVLTVAGVTIANGGDNVGVYIPLFATLTWTNKVTMVIVFLLMTFLTCMAAKYLTKHPLLEKVIDKYGHWITPFVLVLLGIYILYESETFGLLTN
jgi:cadmium resistance transport/sequestration family protein